MAVYGGTAFVIFEATTIIFPRWGLPDWTIDLVLYLLILGAIITFIFGWIYDLTPEGVRKTPPVSEIKEDQVNPSTNGWKIASYISFVVILGLIVLNVIPRRASNVIVDKSVAVLPFDSDGPVSESESYIKGYRTSVHSNLCKIKDIRVLNLLSTEQYRNQPKSIPEIAKELGVGYVLTARGQIINNRVRLTVYLTDANDEIIWSHPYNRKIEVVDDHIDIQSEIAQLVADELHASITPEEKDLIEKIPTTSMAAYDYCMQGNQEMMESVMYREYGSGLEKAKQYFKKALEYDSEYANAYAGLAMVSYYTFTRTDLTGGQYAADYFKSRNLDSMNLLAEKALELDDQIAEAFYAKGYFEKERGNPEVAMQLMDQALDIDPNYTMAMVGAADVLVNQYDYVGSFELFHRAAKLERGSGLALIYYWLSWLYWNRDLPEPMEYCLNEYLSISGDSLLYFTLMYYSEFQHGRFEDGIKFAQDGYALDTTDRDAILILGNAYLNLEMYEQAYPYYIRYFSGLDNSGDLDVNDMNRMGYLLSKLGKDEEAKQYFKEMIGHCKSHIRMNTSYGRQGASFDIAGVYAFLGERDSAYHYLDRFNETNYQIAYIIAMLKDLDPLFEPIRKELRFQQLLIQMEAKYQSETDRVRQWLEENEML